MDGSRLVVSVSMQFEAGGQPENAESPFPQNMEKGYKDLPAGRHLSVSFHDRIGGTPQMVKATYDWVKYIQSYKGVSFKRKDEIAELALQDKTIIREF